jgi:hypothetical protein
MAFQMIVTLCLHMNMVAGSTSSNKQWPMLALQRSALQFTEQHIKEKVTE